jgi:hypothetical protein
MSTRHTTVRLDERLLKRLKAYAKRNGTTMTDVMARAVEGYLAGARPGPPASDAPAPWVLPTYGTGGPRPGVDLTDNSAVREFMEEEDGYFSSM